jgi:hypothetical protein
MRLVVVEIVHLRLRLVRVALGHEMKQPEPRQQEQQRRHPPRISTLKVMDNVSWNGFKRPLLDSNSNFADSVKERRKYLHDLCDELSNSGEFLRHGKVLTHESSGTGRSRALTITLEHGPQQSAAEIPRVFNPYAKPAPTAAATAVAAASATVVSPPQRTAAGIFAGGMSSSASSPLWHDVSPFAAGASADYSHGGDYGDTDDSFSSSFERGGNILNISASTTPTKRKIPPSEAAAEAAELRRALFESAQLATQQDKSKAKSTNIKSCTSTVTALPFRQTPIVAFREA